MLFAIPSILFGAYYLIIGDLIRAACTMVVTAAVLAGSKLLGRSRAPTKVDSRLVNAIVHMYTISFGEVRADDLIRVVAETDEYGYYSKVFHRIRYIAHELGYGFTRATTLVAETVKQPLKDILVRCNSAFSSIDPKGYLEIEASTIAEEFSGIYTRKLESLKVVGGVFSTFQSAVVFIIMTLSMLTVFMGNSNTIFYAYIISTLSLLFMFFGLKMVAPSESLIHIGPEPPRMYRLLRLGIFALAPAAVLSAYAYTRWGAVTSLLSLGAVVAIPGAFGYILERRVTRIDGHYPTLLKSLGENIASTTSMRAALTYLLNMELGPLTELLRRALNRIRLGISNRKSLMIMSSESASHQVYIANRIFLDAIGYGGDPLSIGKFLGNHVVKFLEFRKRRLAVARSFEGISMIMQPITVALLSMLTFLCGYFSGSLTSLPFFEFGDIPMEFIKLANFLTVLLLCVLNALALKEIGAGYWGTFFWKLGLLLIISGASWLGMDLLIENVFMKLMPGFEGMMPY